MKVSPSFFQKVTSILVLAAMKAERELLSSCYTPKSLRVHLCGQSNSKKSAMVHNWAIHQQTFWSGIFGSSQPANETYGLEIVKLTVQNHCADMNFWCYDGNNQVRDRV